MEIKISKGDIFCLIKTSHDDPDKSIVPAFEGDPILVDIIKDMIVGIGGQYGHLINLKQTTNLDLAFAAKALKDFLVEVKPEVIPKSIQENIRT